MSWPIFIISLADDFAKRERLLARLASMGLQAEIFPAVDCRQGVPPEFESWIDREMAKRRLGREMVNPEFGCALSHILIYQEVAKRHLPGAIVLEDDADPQPNLKVFYDKRCYESFSLLHLDYGWLRIWRAGLGRHVDHNGLVTETTVYNTKRTSGYSVRQDAAAHILAAALPVRLPADWPRELQSIGARAVTPRLIRSPEDKSDSSIEAARSLASLQARDERSALRVLFRRIFPEQQQQNPLPRFYTLKQPFTRWYFEEAHEQQFSVPSGRSEISVE